MSLRQTFNDTQPEDISDPVTNTDDTLLHLALIDRDETLAIDLIKAGADVNAQNLGGDTPLHYAARFGLAEAARAMLDADASMEIHSRHGPTPLIEAVKHDSVDVVKLFLERGADRLIDTQRDRRDGFTCLHSAVLGNKLEMTRLLLDHGASPNRQDREELTPLHWAAGEEGREQMIRLLVENGADINKRTGRYGRTVLADAVHWGRIDSVETLLKLGADPNQPNEYGWNTLIYAITQDWPKRDMIETLLRYDADPNQRDDNGKTPLHWALKNYKSEAVDILIKGGADVHAADNDGKTALSMVRDRHYGTGHTGSRIRKSVEQATTKRAPRRKMRRPAP